MTKLNTELSMYLSKDDINNRLKEMANQLSEKYCDACPVIIGILNGSFVFMADLISHFALDNIIREWDQRLSPKLAAGEFFKNDND